MEDRETPRMHKYGESKTTRIMMASIPPSLPVRDLENFRPMDFCSTEYTSVLYWDVRRPERAVDHSLPSSAEFIVNEWNYTSALAIRPHDVDRDNVPFTLHALEHVQCCVGVFGERFLHVFHYQRMAR